MKSNTTITQGSDILKVLDEVKKIMWECFGWKRWYQSSFAKFCVANHSVLPICRHSKHIQVICQMIFLLRSWSFFKSNMLVMSGWQCGTYRWIFQRPKFVLLNLKVHSNLFGEIKVQRNVLLRELKRKNILQSTKFLINKVWAILVKCKPEKVNK